MLKSRLTDDEELHFHVLRRMTESYYGSRIVIMMMSVPKTRFTRNSVILENTRNLFLAFNPQHISIFKSISRRDGINMTSFHAIAEFINVIGEYDAYMFLSRHGLVMALLTVDKNNKQN